MSTQVQHKSKLNTTAMRLIAFGLLLLMCIFKLFLSYKGLYQPEAMEQAQIARSVANNQGFVTKMIRPAELVLMSETSEDMPINFNTYRDVNYAPLNIVSMAAALKVTGHDSFVASRIPMDVDAPTGASTPKQNLYSADYTISAVSCGYFILAMVLAYSLIARLFDEAVSCSVVCCMVVSDLMLDYSISGLAQPLMLCCMLGGLHFLLSAVHLYASESSVRWVLYLAASFVMMTLMCLSGWLSLWIAVGYLVFCAAYFRPYGMYGFVGFIILLLGCSYSMWMNYQTVGSPFGNAFYGIFDCFGGSSESAIRSTTTTVASLDTSQLIMKFFGAIFAQLKSFYVNCGSVLVVPFFFLALFFRYKRTGVRAVKWALAAMWGGSMFGMALYGTDVPLSAGQLAILFAPLFAAYGFSLLFNFMAKINSRHITFAQLRGVSVLFIIFLCAGASIATFPMELYRGILFSEKGSPQYPPYYPPAMNCALHDLTNAEDVIATDLPWAVAWYADRRALWIPKSIDDYQKINNEILPDTGVGVQGIVITPLATDPMIPSAYAPTNYMKSGRPGGLSAISEQMGDFTPLALNFELARMAPTKELFLNNYVAPQNAEKTGQYSISDIVNFTAAGASAQFNDLVPLTGGAAVLYRKRPH